MSEGLVAAVSVGVSGKGGGVEGSLRGVGGVGPDPSPPQHQHFADTPTDAHQALPAPTASPLSSKL